MANKPYRLNNGFDTQGIPLDYQDIMRLQQIVTPDQLSDLSVTANNTVATAILTQSTLVPPVNAQVLTADNSQPNGVIWATPAGSSSPLTTKGDIFTHTTVDARLPVGSNGQVLEADSTQATGLKWVTIVDDPVLSSDVWRFGDGADGNLTLSGNTTVSSGVYVFRYNNLDLAGFTLTSPDVVFIVYVSGTLTLGGGSILCGHGGGTTGGASNQTGGTGAGGNGGGLSAGLFVMARTISGTGSITSTGISGNSGGVGGVVLENKLATGGADGGSTTILYGNTITPATPARGAGGSGGAGGAAASYINTLVARNILAWGNINGVYIGTSSNWYNIFTSAGAGSSGEAQAGIGPAGGSGGGGSGWFTAGGNGGNGDSRLAGTGGGAGGGGGGGASGGVVFVYSNSVPSTLTVSADGGSGGSGAAHGVGVASGNAGGGGGGAGGLAILIAQTGNTATVSASGGSGGASGGGSATGGSPGGAGIVMSLIK